MKKLRKRNLQGDVRSKRYISRGGIRTEISFPKSGPGSITMDVNLASQGIPSARLTVMWNQSFGTGSIGITTEVHSMSVFADDVTNRCGTSRFSVSLDGISTVFAVDRNGSMIGLFRPQLERIQEQCIRSGFLRYLLDIYRKLPADKGPSLSIFLQPLLTFALARPRSFSGPQATEGPPFRGILDPLTVFRRIPMALGILLQSGTFIGPGPSPIPVPGDPPPPENPQSAADALIATWVTAASQQLVGWRYEVNGIDIRIVSFIPAGWTPAGPVRVDPITGLAIQAFTRQVTITFEQVRKSTLCVTRRCPGTCWGSNDDTRCQNYAQVISSWTQTCTETRTVTGFSATPGGGGGPFITPPSASDPPDIDMLSPRPTPP